jgi:hypothetical protein
VLTGKSEENQLSLQKPFKETLCCCTISAFLKKHINNFTILINCSPEVMLLTINLDENFIDKEGIAIPTMFSLTWAQILDEYLFHYNRIAS